MTRSELVQLYTRRRSAMIAYLALKVEEQDWHGVADAAMDLRDIDAALAALEELS